MFSPIICQAYDFWDSFLPAYRMGAEAGAHGVMCAHIAPNGQNACSNKWLLDTLRSWGPVGENSVVLGPALLR